MIQLHTMFDEDRATSPHWTAPMALWLALTFALANLGYEAVPWLVERVPPGWVVRYLEWYATIGAETASRASFLVVLALCSTLAAVALGVPMALAHAAIHADSVLGGADEIRTRV